MRSALCCDGMFRVFEDGRIHRILSDGEVAQKLYINDDGYFFIRPAGKTVLVHRLVASAFIPNPDGKPQVNHIDGDKQNNCVANLEWVTSHENHIHAVALGLSKGKRKILPNKGDGTDFRKRFREPWKADIVRDLFLYEITRDELARELGMTTSYVNMVLSGSRRGSGCAEPMRNAIKRIIERKGG